MSLENSFSIYTIQDGTLADINQIDTDKLTIALAQANKVVFHLSSGLAKKDIDLVRAARLKDTYLTAGAYPIFFIWESGLLETINDNLSEISKEIIFKRFMNWLIKFTVAKLRDFEGGETTGRLNLPTNIEVAKALKKVEFKGEPYCHLVPNANLKPVNNIERQTLEQALANDARFQEAVQAIVDSNVAAHKPRPTTIKYLASHKQSLAKTSLSPEIVDHLVEDAAQKAGKGILSSAWLIKQAGEILVQVIDQFIAKRDHGVYCTVVEAVLRNLYATTVGITEWHQLKQAIAHTFTQPNHHSKRENWFLVDHLSQLLAKGHQPDITLVGHSAGSIYACGLLAYIAQVQGNPTHPMPQSFRFKNMIFLAPTCTFTLFHQTLDNYSYLFENFSLFGLNDENEINNTLVPALYTRSLLYFISGVLENAGDGLDKNTFDCPITGMQRYYLNSDTYKTNDVIAVRHFIGQDNTRILWTASNGGNGLMSVEEPNMLSSLQQIIAHQ